MKMTKWWRRTIRISIIWQIWLFQYKSLSSIAFNDMTTMEFKMAVCITRKNSSFRLPHLTHSTRVREASHAALVIWIGRNGIEDWWDKSQAVCYIAASSARACALAVSGSYGGVVWCNMMANASAHEQISLRIKEIKFFSFTWRSICFSEDNELTST